MKTTLIHKCVLFSLALLSWQYITAKVVLPQVLADNMVLQREKHIHLWGKADANELINISFKGKKYQTQATEEGHWDISLKPSKAGGPYELVINDITLKNILIGDVWLCSGQSNVDIPINRVAEIYEKEVKNDRQNRVRLLKVQNATNIHQPQEDILPTSWKELAPENVWDYSAISYFLAKDLYEKTGIPQGVIACSWGGTTIQSWIGINELNDYPAYQQQVFLLQDDRYVQSAFQTDRLYNHRWNELLYKTDKGAVEQWQRSSTDESDWKDIDVFQINWHRLPEEKSGSYWFRQHIQVDAAHANQSALLRVGTLVDADSTFLNGQFVGTTGYQYPPRKYQIPAGLLKEGDNVITVRIITGGSAPEFIKDKPYKLIFNNKEEIQLDSHWKMKRGAVMPKKKSYGIGIQNYPSVLYNAMLYPLHNYEIAGALWYQGESNTEEAVEYEKLLGILMKNWRSAWKNEQLPFFIVQLPDFMEPSYEPSNSGWVQLRESQRRATVTDANAHLVVGLGLGEWNDIHPLHKKEMAQRASLEIQKAVFHKNVITTPELLKGEIKGAEVILTFTAPIQGDENGQVFDVELGENGHYKNATATIFGKQQLRISCTDIKHPTSVRYAWRNTPPKANLRGMTDLPVGTFQWDN